MSEQLATAQRRLTDEKGACSDTAVVYDASMVLTFTKFRFSVLCAHACAAQISCLTVQGCACVAGRTSDMMTQCKSAKHNADLAKQELNEYKEKASRILQSKDKLIASLKEGANLQKFI